MNSIVTWYNQVQIQWRYSLVTRQSWVTKFDSHPRKPGSNWRSPLLHFIFEPLKRAKSQWLREELSTADMNQSNWFTKEKEIWTDNFHFRFHSAANAELPAHLHLTPKCKVASLEPTKLLPPLNCTPPLLSPIPYRKNIEGWCGEYWNRVCWLCWS